MMHMLAFHPFDLYIRRTTEVSFMRKTIITISTLGSLVLILESLNAGHALTMFLLVGAIPGTSVAIDAAHMLALFASLLGFVLARSLSALHAQLRVLKRHNALSPEM